MAGKDFRSLRLQGINNKIKVLKREAYGFRDERYFKLRLYDLHNKGITSFLGCTIRKTFIAHLVYVALKRQFKSIAGLCSSFACDFEFGVR